jgi:hypothetical protein
MKRRLVAFFARPQVQSEGFISRLFRLKATTYGWFESWAIVPLYPLA